MTPIMKTQQTWFDLVEVCSCLDLGHKQDYGCNKQDTLSEAGL